MRADVPLKRVFQHVRTAVDNARFLPFRQLRPVAGRRKERSDTGAGGANALRERPLGHQFECNLARAGTGRRRPTNRTAAETSTRSS